MIKIFDSSKNFPGNYIYLDHFPGQNRNIMLLLSHHSEDSFSSQILENLLSEIIELDLDNISEDKIISALQSFFVEINWRIYSLLGQRPDLERGVSLFLGVMENDRLYFVQFGRYFMGIFEKTEFKEIGRKWDNLAMTSRDDLMLLGSRDVDIAVKVEQIIIPESSYFLVIDNSAAMLLKNLGLNYLSINEHLNQLKAKDKFGFLLLKFWEQKASSNTPWRRRKRVNRTATILLILIILSAAYVYYGKNLIDDLFSRLKFTRNEFTRNDIKEQFFLLQEQAQDLLNQLANEDMNIAIFPQQKILMESDWEMNITRDFSSNTCFDYRGIYAASGRSMYQIDKRNAEIKWEKSFDSKIEVLRLVDANRILVSLADGKLICLNRDDGKQIWEAEYDIPDTYSLQQGLSVISLNQYRQLDDSVFLIFEGKKLTLSQVRSGEVISEFENDKKIDGISEYDVLDKCIYITAGNKLKKINIKVKT
ncbi:MAG: PQQ-binding-like beta-propeller repeat protein [Candidatus Stygibacter frigidus]|nr:PQQ-binding-like beta-propeller repeat protein [Candidatus Stygibacter frigidus]